MRLKLAIRALGKVANTPHDFFRAIANDLGDSWEKLIPETELKYSFDQIARTLALKETSRATNCYARGLRAADFNPSAMNPLVAGAVNPLMLRRFMNCYL